MAILATGSINWGDVFIPDTPLLEIFVRGTVTYFGVFTLLRLILKRQSGTVAIADLLMVTLLADASQNAMAGEYHSLSDGIFLVAVIIFWNFFLDWVGYRVRWVQRFVHPPPLLLIKDGQLQRHNMRRELVTEPELMSQLREQGVDDLSLVREAYIEGDGQISVVKNGEEVERRRKKKLT